MSDPYVLLDVDGPVAWITLNDPSRLNPCTHDRVLELNEVCRGVSQRDDVRVAIVTGAGRGFCSGADLSAPIPADLKPEPGSGSFHDEGPGLWTLTGMKQPVIAMVNGAAVGYGAELAIQADIRVAAESARFRLPFSRLGTVSDTGAGSWLLPRLIGWSKAADMLYTSRFVNADEAYAIGLINYLVPDASLRAFTSNLANEIASNSAHSLFALKRMIFSGLDDRKREHLIEQYFHYRDRHPDENSEEYMVRFRKA